MNDVALATVELNTNDRASVNYAKARKAINQFCENRAEKRRAKFEIISYLHGILVKGKQHLGHNFSNYVVFEDGSKAVF